MNLTKDVYLYLMNFADDVTILNMLSVNKKFNDEIFFDRIIRRKYPFLVKFKNSNTSWKTFFVKMIYYINILNEYGVSYIPVKEFNPELLVEKSRKMFKKENRFPLGIMLKILIYAAEVGDNETIKNIDKKEPNLARNRLFLIAAKNGKLNTVKFIFEKAPIEVFVFKKAFRKAVKNNHLDVVKYLIEQKILEK